MFIKSFTKWVVFAIIMLLGITVGGCEFSEDIEQKDPAHVQRGPSGKVYDYRHQSQQDEKPQQSTADPALRITDMELQQAAEAKVAINEITQQLQLSVQKTKDADKVHALQLAAGKRIEKAVEAVGLDFDTYTAIMSQVRQDTALDRRFQQKLRHIRLMKK